MIKSKGETNKVYSGKEGVTRVSNISYIHEYFNHWPCILTVIKPIERVGGWRAEVTGFALHKVGA